MESETEELKKEIEELEAKNSFLRTWASELILGEYADIDFEVRDGPKIRAHKIVLISKSPVLKAMLENETEESRICTIKITDFSYEVFHVFVRYMYTAQTFLNEGIAFDLLVLADKYLVENLKTVCEKFLISKVNNDNAIRTFVFAHKHDAKHLREAALSLIIENMDTLKTRDEFHALTEDEPKLALEIYQKYFTEQENTGGKESIDTLETRDVFLALTEDKPKLALEIYKKYFTEQENTGGKESLSSSVRF